jgi:hypothetical protein
MAGLDVAGGWQVFLRDMNRALKEANAQVLVQSCALEN